jgi:hypothetical protein
LDVDLVWTKDWHCITPIAVGEAQACLDPADRDVAVFCGTAILTAALDALVAVVVVGVVVAPAAPAVSMPIHSAKAAAPAVMAARDPK